MLQKNFNANWRFYKEGKKAIEINLPHDAMLEEERIPDLLAGENSAYFPGPRSRDFKGWYKCDWICFKPEEYTILGS